MQSWRETKKLTTHTRYARARLKVYAYDTDTRVYIYTRTVEP